MASLPPLSSETFAEKVLHAQASTRLERERATFERLCKACNKTYYSENAYANHVGSQKHRQNVATQQLNAIRAGGSGQKVVSVGSGVPTPDDKDETGSVVSSTFSLGEPVDAEPGKKAEAGAEEEQLLPKKVEGLTISTPGAEKDDSPPTPAESPVPPAENEPKHLPLEACLFCSYLSPSLQLNVTHMTRAHGMFIPEAAYLVDLEGLIKYLGTKVLIGNQCLYCNKTKSGLEGIQTHMRDKGHTMLGFETEEQQIELGQFYDFRSSYSDYGEESSSSDEAAGREKSKRSLKPKGPADDEGWEDAEGDDAGWETDSSASSLDSTELTSVRCDPEHKHSVADKHRHRRADGFHSHAHHHGVLYHDDYELHLPNGKSVGHRSLARYYRQNLRDHPLQDRSVRAIADTKYPRNEDEEFEDDDMEDGGVDVEGDENQDQQVMNRRERRELAALSKRNEQGMIGLSAAQKLEVTRLAKKAKAAEERGRARYQWGNDKRGNMQKHFRDPLLQ